MRVNVHALRMDFKEAMNAKVERRTILVATHLRRVKDKEKAIERTVALLLRISNEMEQMQRQREKVDIVRMNEEMLDNLRGDPALKLNDSAAAEAGNCRTLVPRARPSPCRRGERCAESGRVA